MKIAVLLAARNDAEGVETVARRLEETMTLPYDLHVVECGSDLERTSPRATLWSREAARAGVVYAHTLAYRAARERADYDYYWVLTPQVELEPGVDTARALVAAMESEPRMGAIAPSDRTGGYPGSGRRSAGGWHKATTCPYGSFLLRAEALEDVGFLDASFRWAWGAVHELSHRLYAGGWFLAFSDEVSARLLGDPALDNTDIEGLDRSEVERRAKRFAHEYFRRAHGPSWPDRLWLATDGHEIEVDTYSTHRDLWASGFGADELARFESEAVPVDPRGAIPPRERMIAPASDEARRVFVATDDETREGWTRMTPEEGHRLTGVEPGSLAAIEVGEAFLGYGPARARQALRAWHRALAPDGELFLELPDRDACIRLAQRGESSGLEGLHGHPDGHSSSRRVWSWSKADLELALLDSGFGPIEFGPARGRERVPGRDLRVRAVRARDRAKGRPLELAARETSVREDARSPWPLVTEAKHLVLAWPQYDLGMELDVLFRTYVRPIADRGDVCLCLRFDPDVDRDPAFAVAAVQTAYERVFVEDVSLEVLIVDDDIPADQLGRLGMAVDAVCELPSNFEPERAERFEAIGGRRIRNVEHLKRILAGEVESSDSTEVEVAATEEVDVDYELVERIRVLHPWMHPAVLDNLLVHPGVGTTFGQEHFQRESQLRAEWLVDEVTRRIDFTGRSVLDLGANCGYWSARYVERGAARVVGIEARQAFLDQAHLYWSTNEFLPEGAWHFFGGDVRDEGCWERIRRLGPYDTTLLTGLLGLVENPEHLLERAASVTRHALIIESSFEAGPGTETGEAAFDAIDEVAPATPGLERIVEQLRALAFDPIVAPTTGADPRVRILAMKQPAARPTPLSRKMPTPKA